MGFEREQQLNFDESLQRVEKEKPLEKKPKKEKKKRGQWDHIPPIESNKRAMEYKKDRPEFFN